MTGQSKARVSQAPVKERRRSIYINRVSEGSEMHGEDTYLFLGEPVRQNQPSWGDDGEA